MSACRHFIVSGRVQGVFFRASTEKMAKRLGLTGWVRNLPDGRVELVACGDDADLAELERWLWEGPSHAHVEQVVTTAITAQSFKHFRVR